jgi:8-oxo-dGTP pyrophosphatase MutT (NUDIX family)
VSNWFEERKQAGGVASGAGAAPAATVALLRDGERGLEVLLGRRSSRLAFHGGAWVFPGGRIDPEDYADAPDDVDAAARRAAARESMEETGVDVDPDALVHLSNWTTPEIAPKRFATWFVVGPVRGGNEIADGAETEAVQWFTPAEALAARDEGEIELAPPQFVTLLVLREYDTVAGAMAGIAATEVAQFQPRLHFPEGGTAMCIYEGDVAYADIGFLDHDGPHHRLYMRGEGGWEYVDGRR